MLNRYMNTERALGTQRRKQLALAEEVGEGFTSEDLIIKVGLESVHVLLGQVAMLVCSWYAHL